MQAPRIFVSSTWLDLRAERHAVEQAMQRMRATRFVGMEYFGASGETTREVSLAAVDRSDVYVGIIGLRYGSGITEDEYRRAVQRGLPCLIYLKRGEGADPDAARLRALRDMLRARHLVAEFDRADELAAAIAVDLHNLLFDRLVVDGLQALRSDYDARIQRFFAEYLGSAAVPMAFGGREGELGRLDRWFDDDRAPERALLAGPAGRGKSALLVHWSRRLARRDDVDVVFVPVSVRFRTNTAAVVFGSLAARLAALHGEVIPGALDTPADAWRALTTTLLRRAPPAGRRVLVVLDGADEAADWKAESDLLPPQLPLGLRVVVSARLLGGDTDGQGWVERLGWTGRAAVIDLAALTPPGMADVLRRMSVPLDRLSGRADIVTALYRLTGGDPLLVNLYVADLWTRGEGVARLRVDDLAAIEPGLEGYFKRWWSDQRTLWGAQSPLREAALGAVLDTLACALGPLKTAELAALVGAAGVPLSVWSLEEAIRALERFVIGDGKAQGYAFTHPRLADHFRDRLAKAGQAVERESRFVGWGLRCLGEDAGAAQADVPDYVVQYLRAHMHRCGRPEEDFVALVGGRWIAAWERLDRGTYGGFAADLDHVRAVAARRAGAAARDGERSAFAAVQWRGALIAGSIVALNGAMPLAVVGALLERGVWSPVQAVAYASRLGDEGQRLRALFACTGWFDAAYQPLAVSAAASAVAAAIRRSRQSVADALRDLARAAAATGASAAAVARTAVGVALVAGQLSGNEGRSLRGHLAELLEWDGDGDTGPGLAAEQRIEAAVALAPYLPEHADRLRAVVQMQRLRLADVPIRAGGVANAMGEDPGPVWLLDRYRQLRDAVREQQLEDPGAPPDLAHAALRAAFGVLLLRSAAVPGERAAANALAARVLCTLSGRDVVEGLPLLLALPGPLPLEALAAHAATLPSLLQRARCEAMLRRACGLPLPAAVARALLDGTAHVAARDAAKVFRAIVDVMAEADLPPWLSALGSRLPLQWITLLAGAGAAEDSGAAIVPRPGAARLFALEALRALERHAAGEAALPPRQDARLQPLAACLSVLCDRIEPPGAGDALEPWRLESRRAEKELVLALEAILDRGRIGAELLQPVADRVAAVVAPAFPQVLQRPALRPPPEWPAVDEEALALHASHQAWMARFHGRGGDEADRHPLHEQLLEREPQASTGAALARLAACARLIDAETLDAAAASVLGELSAADLAAPARLLTQLEVLHRPPFMPPGPALQNALQRLGYEVGAADRGGPGDRVRSFAAAPMPDAVRVPLFAGLAESVAGGELGEVLDAAVEHLVRADVRGLGTAGWFQRGKAAAAAGRALTQDAAGSPQRREDGDGPGADGAGLPEPAADDAARLEALASEARAGHPSRAELCEALALATRLGRDRIAVELAHRVLLRRDEHPQLLAAVVDAALALPDERRGELFAEVAPRLDGDALAAAVQRLRRLDDGLAAVRAMLALLAAIDGAGGRARALPAIAATVERMPAGPPRAAAGALLAPELEPAQRQPHLERAVREGADRCLLVGAAELYARWALALASAPARLLDLTLHGLRHEPARARRGGFGLRLLPLVPEWMRPRVLALVGDDAESVAAAAPWFDAACLERIACRRPQWRGLPAAWAERFGRFERRQRSTAAGPADAGGRVHLNAPRTDTRRHAMVCRLAMRAAALDAGLRTQIVELAAAIGDDERRAEAGAYCAMLAPPGLHATALRAAQAIRSDADRAVALATLASTAPEAQQPALAALAVETAGREADADLAAQALAECLRRLPEQRFPQLLDTALPLLRAHADRDAAWRALGSVIASSSDARAARLVAAMLETDLPAPVVPASVGRDDGDGLEAGQAHRASLRLQRIAADLGPRAARAALAVLEAAADRLPAAVRARALAAVAPRLADDACGAACAQLAAIAVDHAWLDAMLAVAGRWPAAFDAAQARRAVATLAAIADDDVAADALAALAAAWPAAEEDGYFAAAAAIASPAQRCDAIAARCHAAGVSPALRAAAQALPDPAWRSVALLHAAACSDASSAGGVAEALRAVRAAADREAMLDALCDVALRLGRCPAPAFDALLAAQGGYWRIRRLHAIASTLDPRQAWRATEIAVQHDGDPASRNEALIAFAARIGDSRPAEWPPFLAARLSERACAACLGAAAQAADDAAFVQAVVDVACGMRSRVFGAELAVPLLDRIGAAARERVLARFVDAAPNDRERRRVLRMARDLSALPPPVELARRLPALEARAAADGDAPPPDPPLAELLAAAAQWADASGASPGAAAPARPESAPALRQPLAPGPVALLRRLHALPTGRDRHDELLRRFDALSPQGQCALFDQLPALFDEKLQAAFHRAVAHRVAPAVAVRGLHAAARIDDVSALARAMAGWTPRLPAIGAEAVQRVWDEIIDRAAREPRGEALERIVAFAPLLASRSGDGGLAAGIETIADVVNLWP
ncbi:MAG: DUF4062 domain-containing protein [Rubrivivax sp.]